MRNIQKIAVLVILGLFIVSCGSDSDDDGGSTGGSGETETVAAESSTEDSSSASTASTEEAATESTASTSTSSSFTMDARSFNCTSNWTTRDGAWGLTAYTGSGTCSIAFPGEAGSYSLTLHVVLEFDGNSPYSVSINGTTIKQGVYPLATPLGCDCPLENWWIVCPDTDYYINLGTHTLSPGDTITFYGAEDFPCGDHGSYAKWQGILATKN